MTVFTVGLGTKIDPERLKALATISGGQAYFPDGGIRARGAVPANHREPAAPLHPRLHLDELESATEAGETVEIRPAIAGIVVSSRHGYFAPIDRKAPSRPLVSKVR